MAVQRDKIIASAEKLVAKGKIEGAIREYERLLEDNPNDVNTLNRIGDLWVRINRNDEAVKVFGKIAEHYSRDGFFLKAIAIFKKINKLDPSKLEVYAKLADLYAKQGLAMEAKSQYQVLADYYLKHSDPGNALATYRKISELDPNSINVHVKLADLYSQNNQTAEALKEYDRVGRLLLKRGMLDEAVQVFKKALKIDPKNIDLVESLVTALLEAKDNDNAAQILQTAIDANGDLPRLVAMLGRTQIARGDVAAGRSTLERGLAANPDDPAVREMLADLKLQSSDSAGAFEMLSPVATAAAARGDRQALELLNRILRVDRTFPPALKQLAETYGRFKEETNILATMNSLAEAYIARGEHEQAAGVVRELIAKEPDNAQHREKLNFIRQSLGGSEPEPVQLPVSGRTPTLEVESPSMPEISLELDDSPALELDLSLDEPAVEPQRASSLRAVPPPPERSAGEAELDSDGDEDIDFITEQMTEAEVFAKYGLAEKAIEHLRTVLDRAPRHAPAFDRLLRIHLEEGNDSDAVAVANQYIALLESKSDYVRVEAVRAEMVTRGLMNAGPARRLEPVIEELPPLDEQEAIEMPLDLQPEMELPLEFPAAEPEDELELDLDDFSPTGGTSESFVEPLPEETFPISIDDIGTAETLDLDTTEESIVVEKNLDISHEDSLSLDEFAPAAAAEKRPTDEELAEVDFYIEQDLLDDAETKLLPFEQAHGQDSRVRDRRNTLDQRRASVPAAATTEQSGASITADDIANELMSAMPGDDFDYIAPSKPPAQTAAVAEENLFADEDDFFDLAAELEQELQDDAEEMVSLSEEEQSLEEIFREFKKGVESQLDAEDYDTHYNLGIAYKEMGLVDEAIGEFQLASKDPKRVIECCSMLGLCFLEKGMPQLAIKWYRKGLEVPEINEDEHIGLLYDLGSAHVEVGDTDTAHKAFIEIYGIRSNYRDIAKRIKQLEDSRA